ncbi:MAG TPA: hypothetical protein VM537_33585, partial [Anaerolineae bacterium]|nr:hypothetical protein [Anaerolineae bacterium]
MNAETLAGLIAGPITTLIVAIVKGLFADNWAESLWKKSIVFAIVLVACALVTAAVGILSGSLSDVRSFVEMYAVALA